MKKIGSLCSNILFYLADFLTPVETLTLSFVDRNLFNKLKLTQFNKEIISLMKMFKLPQNINSLKNLDLVIQAIYIIYGDNRISRRTIELFCSSFFNNKMTISLEDACRYKSVLDTIFSDGSKLINLIRKSDIRWSLFKRIPDDLKRQMEKKVCHLLLQSDDDVIETENFNNNNNLYVTFSMNNIDLIKKKMKITHLNIDINAIHDEKNSIKLPCLNTLLVNIDNEDQLNNDHKQNLSSTIRADNILYKVVYKVNRVNNADIYNEVVLDCNEMFELTKKEHITINNLELNNFNALTEETFKQLENFLTKTTVYSIVLNTNSLNDISISMFNKLIGHSMKITLKTLHSIELLVLTKDSIIIKDIEKLKTINQNMSEYIRTLINNRLFIYYNSINKGKDIDLYHKANILISDKSIINSRIHLHNDNFLDLQVLYNIRLLFNYSKCTNFFIYSNDPISKETNSNNYIRYTENEEGDPILLEVRFE